MGGLGPCHPGVLNLAGAGPLLPFHGSTIQSSRAPDETYRRTTPSPEPHFCLHAAQQRPRLEVDSVGSTPPMTKCASGPSGWKPARAIKQSMLHQRLPE